jgi:outer membrane lipoprotein-sorting protein
MRLRLVAPLAIAGVLLSACPKPPIAVVAPPKVEQGPVVTMLAARDARIHSVRAAAVIRSHLPPGMQGVPGKLHAQVLDAARPDRVRLEFLTPLGTPAATVLLAGGKVQVYQPLDNTLLEGPIDSPSLDDASPLPVPLTALPAMLRGAVAFGSDETAEIPVPAVLDSALGPAASLRALEVRRGGAAVQRLLVDADGGYPVEDQRLGPDGQPTLTIDYLEYAGVVTSAGAIAFPQRVTARIVRAEGIATLDVALKSVEINPTLPADAFTLAPDRPPRVEEFR